MRTRAFVVLAAMLLITTSGSAGWLIRDSVYDGVRMRGELKVAHFRPLIVGGCETEQSKTIAFQNYGILKHQLAKLFTPAMAYAMLGDTGCKLLGLQTKKNLIVNAGETALRDCFNNNSGTECTDVISTLKYHGLGESTTAAGETDTGCLTELTTDYNPDNTRATGSQATNGANVYRTIGTNTVDGAAAVTEFCLMNVATSTGILWSRVVFTVVNLSASDSLQTTYDLTIE